MNIWVPNVLYQVFPLLCVIVGFLMVMFVCNPAGIVLATCLYVYSFRVLWLRVPSEEDKEEKDSEFMKT